MLSENIQLAEDHFKEALRIKQKHYPSDHASMGDSYYGMGLVYKHRRDYQRALPLLVQALTIQDKMLGPDHEASLKLQADLDEVKIALV